MFCPISGLFAHGEFNLHGFVDPVGDVVLYCKKIIQFTVVTLGPKLLSAHGIYQLGGDPQLPA